MNILELMKGKKMMVMTDMYIEVELEIKEVRDTSYSYDIEPSTRENDWWPKSNTVPQYTVYFTNGAHKTFNYLSEIHVKP